MDYEDRQTSSRSDKLQTSRFQSPTSEQFLDEANAAREELLAEIQQFAETDVGAEPAENQRGLSLREAHV